MILSLLPTGFSRETRKTGLRIGTSHVLRSRGHRVLTRLPGFVTIMSSNSLIFLLTGARLLALGSSSQAKQVITSCGPSRKVNTVFYDVVIQPSNITRKFFNRTRSTGLRTTTSAKFLMSQRMTKSLSSRSTSTARTTSRHVSCYELVPVLFAY